MESGPGKGREYRVWVRVLMLIFRPLRAGLWDLGWDLRRSWGVLLYKQHKVTERQLELVRLFVEQVEVEKKAILASERGGERWAPIEIPSYASELGVVGWWYARTVARRIIKEEEGESRK